MRDKTHDEFIEKWANFVKNNPNWKKQHTEFINSQFEKSERFIKNLIKEKNGRDKIINIYKIRNFNGYKKILENSKSL